MSTNTHDRETGNTRPRLRLKLEKFDLITRVLGCESDTDRAELLGITYMTVYRARNGYQIGEVFVSATIAAFQRHAETLSRYGITVSLDELFEVVEPQVQVAA